MARNEGAADGGRERIRRYSQDGGGAGSGTRWELHRDVEIYLQSLRSADFQTACALLDVKNMFSTVWNPNIASTVTTFGRPFNPSEK